MTASAASDNKLESFSYPRTGKRGVPQQFPRRLFEMLESETKMIEASPEHPKVIFWSDSGRAFRIVDVTIFASTVLPRYFRTKKFSSFQRNLNLYGFSKVRRGPETDMYAHPTFVRNQQENLCELRKITSSSNRRRSISSSNSSSSGSHEKFHGDHPHQKQRSVSRAVSPSPPRIITTQTTDFHDSAKPQVSPVKKAAPTACYAAPTSPTTVVWPSSNQSGFAIHNKTPLPSIKNDGRGRLDLLAMALEREAYL